MVLNYNRKFSLFH